MVLLMTFGFISCKAEVVPTYTVTYSSEHGTAPGAISVEENTILTESQLPALSDGTWVFKGWYVNNVKVVAGEYQVTGNVTLTAQWAATATVSYHSKFGTVPQSFERELNQTLTEENLNAMTCSPYTFLGWFYEKDDDDNGTGTQAQAGDAISTDLPLYAKWQTATITRIEHSTNIRDSYKKYTGEKVTERDIFRYAAEITGQPFVGWFIGTTQVTTDFVITEDITFNARWAKFITFNANGGSGNNYKQTINFGTTDKLNANTFTKEGYAFAGWNTAPDGSGTTYENEGDYFVADEDDTILYAQWEPAADENNIVDMITNMTESGIIVAKGNFSNDLIRQINSALKTLPKDVLVFLDLYNVTGLTELEDVTFVYNPNAVSYDSFYGCKKLSGIILPESVTSIGDYAFGYCTNLTTIAIPNGVTSIGDETFRSCRSLTTITIPDGVTSIGDYTFTNCRNLTGITISDRVTSIGNFAFSGCSNLESITLPDELYSIGNYAFEECSSLTSMTLPFGITQIGKNAFKDCKKLTDIYAIDKKSGWYSRLEGSYTESPCGSMNIDSKIIANIFKQEDRYFYKKT